MGSAIIFQDTTNTTQVKLASDNSNVLDGTEVALGTDVYDTVTLSGTTATAGGTVTYFYSTTAGVCTSGSQISQATVTNGVAGQSATISLDAAGTYEFWAVYSGDANNSTSTSECGTETVVVPVASNTIGTAQSLVPNDEATLGGLTANAGGTVNFKLFGPDNTTCSELGTAPIVNQTVNVLPDDADDKYNTSNTTAVTAEGTYNWLVVYSGDANNSGATSACGAETFSLDNDSTN
jgi:hypothetical protein